MSVKGELSVTTGDGLWHHLGSVKLKKRWHAQRKAERFLKKLLLIGLVPTDGPIVQGVRVTVERGPGLPRLDAHAWRTP
jgi:hypothetical protein